jgi:hypothetical protein
MLNSNEEQMKKVAVLFVTTLIMFAGTTELFCTPKIREQGRSEVRSMPRESNRQRNEEYLRLHIRP